MTNDPVLLIVQWLDSVLCNQYIAWNEENFKFIILRNVIPVVCVKLIYVESSQ